MNYYQINFLYLTDKTDCGISPLFMHLPVSYQTTTDKEEAMRWFDAAVKSAVRSWNGSKLVYVKDEKLDYRCMIKQAKFECNEAAYMKGEYIIELNCYNHNPLV